MQRDLHTFIHQQIHASFNILLDANMMVKVSDFGLSRLPSLGGNTMHTMNVRCSLGYEDPKFIQEGILKQKRVMRIASCPNNVITSRKARDEFKNYLSEQFCSSFAKGKRVVSDMMDEEIIKREDSIFFLKR